MGILAHPILLSFPIAALALLFLSLFLPKGKPIPVGFAIVLIALYTVNGLLMGIPYLEVIIPLLVLAILFIPALLIKERRR